MQEVDSHYSSLNRTPYLSVLSVSLPLSVATAASPLTNTVAFCLLTVETAECMTECAAPLLLTGRQSSDSLLSDESAAAAKPVVSLGGEADSFSSSEPALRQTYELSNETSVSTGSSEFSDLEAYAEKQPSFTPDLEPQHEEEDEEEATATTERSVSFEETPDDPEGSLDKRSSSFENIYQQTTLVAEAPPTVEHIEVGDRFDTKHVPDHLGQMVGKLCSFENLYRETVKEAKSVEEKDVDEKEDEQKYIDLPEKGAHEDQKEFERVDSLPEAEQMDVVEEEEAASSSSAHSMVKKAASLDLDIKVKWHPVLPPPKLVTTQFFSQSSPPIDVTYESGLDLVGQEQQLSGTLESGHDNLERSQSYDIQEEQRSGSRSRHYSSPEDMLHALGDDEAQEDKGTLSSESFVHFFLRYCLW